MLRVSRTMLQWQILEIHDFFLAAFPSSHSYEDIPCVLRFRYQLLLSNKFLPRLSNQIHRQIAAEDTRVVFFLFLVDHTVLRSVLDNYFEIEKRPPAVIKMNSLSNFQAPVI